MTPPSPSLLDHPFASFLLVYIVPPVIVALLGALTWLALQSGLFFAEKKKTAKEWGFLELVPHYFFDALLTVGTEFHREYKKLAEDGELSAADRAILRSRLVALGKDWLGARKLEWFARLKDWGGTTLESWLGAQADKALGRLVTQKGALTIASAGGLPAAVAATGVPALSDTTKTPAFGTLVATPPIIPPHP